MEFNPIENLPVAILAGGLATRLHPITEQIPKALVPVAGEPFLSHQLRLLHRVGIRKAVLCVGFLGEMIEKEFGAHAHGVDLVYAFDGPKLLGTAGAIRRALPYLGSEFFVLYGDSYLAIDFAEVAIAWWKGGKPGMMTVFRNDGAWDASNVQFADGELLRYDKRHKIPEMRYIDYGLSLFRSHVFEGLHPDEPADLAEVQRGLVETGGMAGHEVFTRFYEIGSHAGLMELDQLFSRLHPHAL